MSPFQEILFKLHPEDTANRDQVRAIYKPWSIHSPFRKVAFLSTDGTIIGSARENIFQKASVSFFSKSNSSKTLEARFYRVQPQPFNLDDWIIKDPQGRILAKGHTLYLDKQIFGYSGIDADGNSVNLGVNTESEFSRSMQWNPTKLDSRITFVLAAQIIFTQLSLAPRTKTLFWISAGCLLAGLSLYILSDWLKKRWTRQKLEADESEKIRRLGPEFLAALETMKLLNNQDRALWLKLLHGHPMQPEVSLEDSGFGIHSENIYSPSHP